MENRSYMIGVEATMDVIGGKPKVEYSLSDYGRSLSDILDSLCSWGEQHVAHLQEQGQDICLKAN